MTGVKPGASLSTILMERAEQHPDRLAGRFLRDGTSASAVDWTYQDLVQRAAVVADVLRDRQLEGKRVVLAVDPGLPYVAALFGIFDVGATAVPSFPPTGKRAVARFASIFNDCAPDLILADPRYDRQRDRIDSSLHTADANGSRPQWLFVDDGFFDERGDGAGLSLLADRRSLGSEPALLQYTSGSTGAPKGVAVTHDNLVSNCVALHHHMGHDPNRLGVSWLPPYHDMGLMGYIMYALFGGYPFVQMSPIDFVQHPYRWLKAITDYKATITATPNFGLDLCTDTITDEELETLDLSTLREVYCGAEPVVKATLDRFRDRFVAFGYPETAMIPCYGMAEATLFVSGKPVGAQITTMWADKSALESGHAKPVEPGHPGASELVSCGVIAADHDVLVVDPEAGRPLPNGQVGEIWVSGPSVTVGYYGKPTVTSETFGVRLAAPAEGEADRASDDRRFLRTGDLGFLLDNQLYVTGRIKDLIIVAGRNIYPQDVEQSARQASPLIQGVAAFSVTDDGAEELVVVVELLRGARPTAAEVDEVCAGVVEAVTADHGASPTDVYVGPAGTVRTTNSGKVQRTATRDGYRKGELKRLALTEDREQLAVR